MSIFAKSFIIGLSIAAPVGPIGLLCVQRSLIGGWRNGFATGLGAATADGIYGLIGALGISMVIASLAQAGPWLSIGGGIYLCYLGYKSAISAPSGQEARTTTVSVFRSFISTLFLTLSNPMTILSFVAIFSALGAEIDPATNQGIVKIVVFGVFIGSATWWLALSGSISLVGHRVSEEMMKFINFGSGLIVIGFGIYQSYIGLLRLI